MSNKKKLNKHKNLKNVVYIKKRKNLREKRNYFKTNLTYTKTIMYDK